MATLHAPKPHPAAPPPPAPMIAQPYARAASRFGRCPQCHSERVKQFDNIESSGVSAFVRGAGFFALLLCLPLVNVLRNPPLYPDDYGTALHLWGQVATGAVAFCIAMQILAFAFPNIKRYSTSRECGDCNYRWLV